MERKRLLLVGLEENEVSRIREKTDYLIVVYDLLPKIRLSEGELWVESASVFGKYLKVDRVIFHGIFDDDFDFITLLALWNGPCLPNAHGMMDLRLRHPGLVRALKVSRFGAIPRGASIQQETWHSDTEIVAKWSNWHCGENKHKFHGNWETGGEITVFEPFIEGEAVRIMLVGDRFWQIRLTGEDWLKSIHHDASSEMEVDTDLLADSRELARHFNMQMVGVDYMVGNDGQKYLLEVNHIPNVTVFDFVNEAFIEYAIDWCESDQ